MNLRSLLIKHSGKLDYATFYPGTNIIYDGGSAENILTDKRDVGRFVARIVKDERTINKKVVAITDLLSQNQIWDIVERASGEKIDRPQVSIAWSASFFISLTHVGLGRGGCIAACQSEGRGCSIWDR